MDRNKITEKRNREIEIREHFNKQYQLNAEKRTLAIGRLSAHHEFDLFEDDKVIGGITTSPWIVGKGSNNTGGQDRVAAELLWLSLWSGNERCVMILSDREMAEKISLRFKGCTFSHQIEILFYDIAQGTFTKIGLLV